MSSTDHSKSIIVDAAGSVLLRRLMVSRNLIIGLVLVAIFLIAAILSFVWTPFDVTRLDIPNKLKSPSSVHWFGTDHFGRDIFSMVMVGARTSIAVALVAVSIGMLAGVPSVSYTHLTLPTKA